MRYTLMMLAVAFVGVPAAGQDKQKKVVQVDNATKRVVGPFVTALGAKDADGVMKVVDVPWYHNGNKVIRNRDDLKKEFQEVLAKRNYTMVGFNYKAISRFSDVAGELTDQQREQAKGVVDKDDMVVSLTLYFPKNGEHDMHLILRFRKGEGKIIGVID